MRLKDGSVNSQKVTLASCPTSLSYPVSILSGPLVSYEILKWLQEQAALFWDFLHGQLPLGTKDSDGTQQRYTQVSLLRYQFYPSRWELRFERNMERAEKVKDTEKLRLKEQLPWIFTLAAGHSGLRLRLPRVSRSLAFTAYSRERLGGSDFGAPITVPAAPAPVFTWHASKTW